MDKRVKALWIGALRSGKYEQGEGVLRTSDDKYCCLGVLCDLAIEDGVDVEWVMRPDESAYTAIDTLSERSLALPAAVAEWAGVTPWGDDASRDRETLDLTGLNDGGASFGKIANVIEQKL